MSETKVYRGFINQPSTLQPLHDLHGQNCIVEDWGDRDTIRIHFTHGATHSMLAPRLSVNRVKISSAEDGLGMYY